MKNRVMRLPDVMATTGLSKSGISNKVKDGTFPPPVELGRRSIGWLSSEIDAWLERLVELRDKHSEKSAEQEAI